jgi:hypothetical protein
LGLWSSPIPEWLASSFVLERSKGVHESIQWVIFEPAMPPVDGIKFVGSDDNPRMILGRNPRALVLDKTKDTSIVIVGG